MDDVIQGFLLALRAEGKAPKTVKIYHSAVLWLQRGLGPEEDWEQLTRAHIRGHIAGILETRSAAYASNQFRALQQFCRYLAAEKILGEDVMAGLRPPRVPPKLVPVIGDAEWEALVATCSETRFTGVRDRAIFELFRATGCRRAEIAGLKVTDVDLAQLAVIVTGKGGRMRIARFDPQAGAALIRYLRLRKTHRHAQAAGLWVGMDGALYPDAISLMFRRRCGIAGIKVNPHMFRHTFAHRWLAAGGQENDLKQQAGWSSSQMLARYGASAAAERARVNYDRVFRKR